MSNPSSGLEIRLASRPSGWPTQDNFALVEAPVAEPAAGDVLVRNVVMSVDPYMRGRMNDMKSYVPPFQIDQPLEGGAIGEVVASNADGIAVGTTVLHNAGWREYATLPGKHVTPVDPALAPVNSYLGVLGVTGLTAYAGLVEVAAMKPGDVVFVSGAAGAVGSIAGQLAKLRGASRVIGSAGSAEKVRHLTEDLGFDAGFNYKDGPVVEQLKAAAPSGIDVYFDNVGGDHLEAALAVLNDFGRVAECGMISQYNNTTPEPGPRNMAAIVQKRLMLRGFIVLDHLGLQAQFLNEVGGWLREGKITSQETVVEGLRNAPQAFLDMMQGKNIGKMLVTI